MTVRADAMAYVHRAVCGALGTAQCYPMVQPDPSLLPAVVYYAVGQDTMTPLAGPYQTATAIRVEARDKTYAGAVAVSAAVVMALRKGGRLSQLLSLVDDYDEDLNIYRRIRSVMVRH